MDFTLHPLEVFAVLCNIVYVVLAARENVWCWLFGILGSGSSIVLFVHSRLYAEAVLFVFYVVMGFYGWILWHRSKKTQHSESSSKEIFSIQVWPVRHHLIAILSGIIASGGIGLLLHTYTDAQYPYLDSFTTVFSIFTTWMVAKKILENWLYWIVLNTLSIFLYQSRDLHLYAMLSIIYVAMAVYGFVNWRSDYKSQIEG